MKDLRTRQLITHIGSAPLNDYRYVLAEREQCATPTRLPAATPDRPLCR